MEDDALRVPRDVVVHPFRGGDEDPLLMLRRIPKRGGFWQAVSGAPLVGESDRDAAIREVREETGFDVSNSLLVLGVEYDYQLNPAARDRWMAIYGPGVETVHVTSFTAEVPNKSPVLDPAEHDSFLWCSFETASQMLDWPVEREVLADRRSALSRVHEHLVADGLDPGRSRQPRVP